MSGFSSQKKLQAHEHEVLVLEKDARQAQRLATILGEECVFLGDGCETSVQKASGFGRADVVVAVTGEDEDNMVVCQMAKIMWNVKRVVARVNDPTHEDIFRQIGIDDCVSATAIIFNLIDQQISSDEMIPLGAIAKGNIEVVEAILSHRSPLVGKKVRDVKLPTQTNIVWINRGGEGVLVSGETDLREGDELVAVVPTGQAEALQELLHTDKF